MRVFLLISILLSSICQIFAQKSISFPSEFIDFKIDNNYFSINGIYSFRNNTDQYVNKKILFPFAVKTCLIDSIRIINLQNLKSLAFNKEIEGITFNIQIPPDTTIEINIFYRQQLSKTNSYILTTTKSWGAPLEKAVYSLVTNKNLKILSLSLEPDSSRNDSLHTTYFWHKQNFTPQTNFEVIIDE